MLEYGFPLTRILPYKDRIVINSVSFSETSTISPFDVWHDLVLPLYLEGTDLCECLSSVVIQMCLSSCREGSNCSLFFFVLIGTLIKHIKHKILLLPGIYKHF